jgi:hypothetical protein
VIYDALALQLVCHAVGDYVLQNHWMALKKTQSWPPALIHALLYTVPFAVVFGLVPALAVIGVTHAVIDRYRLANYWVRFWGTGCEGWITRKIRLFRERRFHDGGVYVRDPADVPIEDAPPWLGVWLMIIADNTFHVVINAVALYYLGDLTP